MKKVILSLLVTSISWCVLAQKDKMVYSNFNVENDVITVFKSGAVALYSNPDLSLIKEVSPGDKKNKADNMTSQINNSGNYLMVYDKKIDKVIFYDAKTLDEVKRVDKKYYGLYEEAGLDRIYILDDKKIYSLPNWEEAADLSDHEMRYPDIVFSKSGKYYMNYDADGLGKKSKFNVHETATGEKLGNSFIGRDDGKDYAISNPYFINDEKIAVIYEAKFANETYKWIVPVQLGVDFDEDNSKKFTNLEASKSKGIRVDHANGIVVYEKFATDISDNYSFMAMMNACQSVSKDGQFMLLSSPKNDLRLLKNDPESSEKLNEYTRCAVLKDYSIPKE